eukprot:scaffold113162_cov27-Phaeocystis_antarctica.AAC.1
MQADSGDEEKGAREEEQEAEGEEEEHEQEGEQQEHSSPKAVEPARPQRRQTLAGDGPWAVKHAASQVRRS